MNDDKVPIEWEPGQPDPVFFNDEDRATGEPIPDSAFDPAWAHFSSLSDATSFSMLDNPAGDNHQLVVTMAVPHGRYHVAFFRELRELYYLLGNIAIAARQGRYNDSYRLAFSVRGSGNCSNCRFKCKQLAIITMAGELPQHLKMAVEVADLLNHIERALQHAAKSDSRAEAARDN